MSLVQYLKTFTIALALENNLVTPKTIIKNIPRSIKMPNHEISDIKDFPKDLSVRYLNKVFKYRYIAYR